MQRALICIIMLSGCQGEAPQSEGFHLNESMLKNGDRVYVITSGDISVPEGEVLRSKMYSVIRDGNKYMALKIRPATKMDQIVITDKQFSEIESKALRLLEGALNVGMPMKSKDRGWASSVQIITNEFAFTRSFEGESEAQEPEDVREMIKKIDKWWNQ